MPRRVESGQPQSVVRGSLAAVESLGAAAGGEEGPVAAEWRAEQEQAEALLPTRAAGESSAGEESSAVGVVASSVD